MPPEILRRRTKGGTSRYFVEIVQNNVGFLKEYLLEDRLAQEKLLVRSVLEPILIGNEPIPMDYHANAVLTAVGHNLRLALRWLRAMLSKIVTNILHALITISPLTKAS